MFRLILFVALQLSIISGASYAQDTDNASFDFGGDAYRAGKSVTLGETTEGDVFMAGDRLQIDAAATGSVHLVGRNVSVEDGVGGNLYAAGQSITVNAPVAGNATLMGQDIVIREGIFGNIRVAGQNVTLDNTIGGSAMLAGETLTINSTIAGDVNLAGEKIIFGSGARIEGALTLNHSDPESIVVPASVIDDARIERVVTETDMNWVDHSTAAIKPSFWTVVKGMIGSIVAVTLGATILAALFPRFVAGARASGLSAPVRTGWMGFLALSASIGSLFLVAATGIGVLLVPVSILLTILLGFLGYVLGVYILGVGVLSRFGVAVPDGLGDWALAALVGAVIAALVAFIPFIGWLCVLALVWFGAGAFVTRMFRPAFYNEN